MQTIDGTFIFLNCIEDFMFSVQEYLMQNQYLPLILIEPIDKDNFQEKNIEKKIRKQKQEPRIHKVKRFNQHGDILDQSLNEQEQFKINEPAHRVYKDSKSVNCCFCKQSSNNNDIKELVGKVYGPFTINKQSYYMHLMCAIWTSGVYVDENLKFKNLGFEIKRSKKNICDICFERGAGLGCFVSNCKKSYHYRCVVEQDESQCNLNQQKYTLYCPEHIYEYKIQMQEQEDEINDFDIDEMVCEECNDGTDEDIILICENRQCNKGYHIYCLNPKLDKVPDDDWYCSQCTKERLQKIEQYNQLNQQNNIKIFQE